MAASVATPTVSVEEYLHSVYKPDMDLVDGVLEDRNVGEFDHWRIQRALLEALIKGEKTFGYYVVQETRTQISPARFRVPDTCLIPRNQFPDRIIRTAPLLCVEVLSPEDRFVRMKVKCNDYLEMGVPEVWVIDPSKRVVSIFRGDTISEHFEGAITVPDTSVEVSLKDLFGILDEK